MMQYKKAAIMEIERFAIHDGPGIRSTVFFQGCPLRCPWCANPESQEIGSHLMYQEQKCVHCLRCMNTCPAEAISFEKDKLYFQREKCLLCNACAKVCPNGAIHFIGTQMTTDKIFETLKKDEAYYLESSGGITFSGGEPFFQFAALKELLEMCHGKYHTAIETTGDTEWNHIEDVLPLTDLFLFDVKHYDAEWIANITKGNGKRIQENFRKLSQIASHKIVARVPVIPGYNYEAETLKCIFCFVRENNVKHVNLLPYHTLGADKYRQLGRQYELNAHMLSKKDLAPYRELGKTYGLEVE